MPTKDADDSETFVFTLVPYGGEADDEDSLDTTFKMTQSHELSELELPRFRLCTTSSPCVSFEPRSKAKTGLQVKFDRTVID